jgi:hypothetical protein
MYRQATVRRMPSLAFCRLRMYQRQGRERELSRTAPAGLVVVATDGGRFLAVHCRLYPVVPRLSGDAVGSVRVAEVAGQVGRETPAELVVRITCVS